MIEGRSTLEALRSRLAESEQREAAQPPQRQSINVSDAERWVSLASGFVLTMLGISRRGIPGMVIGGVGGALLYRGATGHCPAYQAAGVDTAHERAAGPLARAVRVAQSFTIGKSAQELYQYWRDFANLPRIMHHLESVNVIDDRRSHWVAKAPSIAGGQVEWDAEITADEPDTLIAWRSLPGADIENAGSVRFFDRGDRGTTVTVNLEYVAPAGRMGKWVAKLFGEEPEQQVREDLRNFKRVMETGEVVTIAGQPRGTCTGTGESPEEQ
jgi:uncharacterized membrane protein